MRKTRKTRNQWRRELIEKLTASAILLAVCFLLMTLLCGMACKAWVECPAEQPVDGHEYIAMVQGWGADHAIQNG